MTETNPFNQPDRFERAIRRILRPLVRALIAHNVTVTALYRIVKRSYVDVAEEMLGDAATDSRISVMTGVHRRDVKDFRSTAEPGSDAAKRKVSTLTTVVGRWMSMPDYVDATGRAKALPRSAEEGPSFEALVQSVSLDIRARTILDELLRQGVVELRDETVHLVLDGLVGTADTEQRLHFFARNLGDHMHAAVDNILADAPPHMERAVFYNALDAASVDEIEEEARTLANRALQQVNTTAAGHQSTDAVRPDATHRFRFGVFFYREDEASKPEGRDPDDDS